MKSLENPTRLEVTVFDFLRKRNIKSVLAGVSGGADSVALLLSLLACGVEILAVNCNFHLRGEESDRDSRFVSELCRRLGVNLISLDFDVNKYLDANGGSVEMACRELRYAEFSRIMKENGTDRIAVAHNSDDQVETLFLNLFRGSGIKGMRGMKEDTGKIIRPLLSVSRKEIEQYLQLRNQDYVNDSTNKDTKYLRNFIRNELLPLIESRWPAARQSVLRTASIMEKEERVLSQVEKELELDHDVLSFEKLTTGIDPEWIIRRFVVSRGGSETLASEIYSSSKEYLSGKRWNAPDGEFVFSSLGLEWIDHKTSLSKTWEVTNFENSPELMERIKRERNNHEFWTSIPPEMIEFRPPRVGDRIRPLGMKGSRLVSDVISEAKLSVGERRSLKLAVNKKDGEILWVEGLKRSGSGLIMPENKIVWRFVGKSESND